MNGTLRWLANTEPDLAGYYAYHGFVTGVYDPGIFVAAPTLEYVFTNLALGVTHYFAVKAADTTGNLSSFSAEVTLRHEFPILVQDRRLGSLARRANRQWDADASHTISGYVAEAIGLNLVPPPPPPPDDIPIYSPFGGFMIV